MEDNLNKISGEGDGTPVRNEGEPAQIDDTEAAIRAIARSSLGSEGKASRIAHAIREAGEYRWVGLYEVSGGFVSILGWDGPGPPAHPRFHSDLGLCGAAVATRAPVIVDDVAADDRYLTTFGTTRAEMVIPVQASSGVIGLVDIESDRVAAFDDRDRFAVERWAAAAVDVWRRRT